jgi:hypothetical protein
MTRGFDIFEVCSKSLKTGRVGLCGTAQLRGCERERVKRDSGCALSSMRAGTRPALLPPIVPWTSTKSIARVPSALYSFHDPAMTWAVPLERLVPWTAHSSKTMCSSP